MADGYNQQLDDYKNISTTHVDEEIGTSEAKEFLSKSSAENYADFIKAPIGFMSSLTINPERELSPNVQQALLDLNAQIRPIRDPDAFSKLETLSSSKAKEVFKSLASSHYGVDNIENLTKEQADFLMNTDEIKALNTGNISTDSMYLKEAQKAFDERQAVIDYDKNRMDNLNTIWSELEPVAHQKAVQLLGGNPFEQNNVQDATYRAPLFSNSKDNISVTGNEQSPYTYDPDKVSIADKPKADRLMENGATINGAIPQTPTMTTTGETPTTPGVTVDGSLENDNFTYDPQKMAEAAPITIQGNVPNNGPYYYAPDGNNNDTPAEPYVPGPASKPENQPPVREGMDFSEGFKLSEEAREKIAERNHANSFWGIVEEFSKAKSPEQAFQNLFIRALLYLPNQVAWGLDLAAEKVKEKTKYIQDKVEQYDQTVADARGMGAHDRFESVHQLFIESCGNMPEAAAKLRKEHPELLDGLKLKFDKDGRMIGDLSKGQMEELRNRMLDYGYFQTYGHPPTNATLKKLADTSKSMMKGGEYERLGRQKQRREQPTPEQPTPEQPTPEQPTPQQPTPEQPTPEQPTPQQPTPQQPTPEQPTPQQPTPEQPTPQQPTPQQPTPEQPTPQQPTPEQPTPEQPIKAEDLQVDPTMLRTTQSGRDQMIAIDTKPLAERPKMNLSQAHDFSISVTTPAALKNEIGHFSTAAAGVRSQQAEVSANREALKLARMPRADVNRSISIENTGAER